MHQISDFEFADDWKPSRFWQPGEPKPEPIADVPPPNRYWRDYKYTDGCSRLTYCGRDIRHIHLNGYRFLAQYRCREGFFLITGDVPELRTWKSDWNDERITIAYLREDFSGSQWTSLFTRWTAAKDPFNQGLETSEIDFNPIRRLVVKSEDKLHLTLKGGERYSLTIHIPPRRFMCTQDFSNSANGPYWFHKRYLGVNRVFW